MSKHHSTNIRVCRVYRPPAHKEGTWILVDRLWPRGLKKDKLAFDLWCKEIAPSAALRQWFHHAPENWSEFSKLYIKELKAHSATLEQIKNMAKKAPVTLFYAAKDEQHNHALILQMVLSK